MSGSGEPAGLSMEMFDSTDCLIYGIGNCGRRDDGLGWAFIDRVEDGALAPRAQLRRTYQLMFEDADLISHYARVLFVDATKDPAVHTFEVSRPEPELDLTFTSHALSVPAILATTLTCFDYLPECHVLAIRGYEWDLRQGLTDAAAANLDRAVR